MLDSLKTRTGIRRKAGEIYGAIVTQARRPEFYAVLGVPDTPDGRYEMVVLHLFCVLERLRAAEASEPLPRLLVEAFIADMDDSLRELGTGDLAVPKKVRRAASGLYERSMAYRAALAAGDAHALAAVLGANVYQGVQSRQAAVLADYLVATLRGLGAAGAAQILDARLSFPAPPGTLAEA
jgi:cytochrome b pre-mRNA-processing protein 3